MTTNPKLAPILSLLTPLLQTRTPSSAPLFLALSGIQGSGKSTLVTQLCSALTSAGYRPISLSLDDFYLPFEALQELGRQYPGNKLLEQRGQPGTHDVRLADEVLAGLRGVNTREGEGEGEGEGVKLPAYDKGAKGGRGDRVGEEGWRVVKGLVDVVVLEGWCVGFQPLREEDIRAVYEQAKMDNEGFQGTDKKELAGKRATGREVLLEHSLEDLLFVNERLGEYCKGFMGMEGFDAVVRLDAGELEWVYEWRLEQEKGLRARGGGGMSDVEVVAFVLRYMPAYVLYLDTLRKGVREGRQLRIVMGRDRGIVRTEIL